MENFLDLSGSTFFRLRGDLACWTMIGTQNDPFSYAAPPASSIVGIAANIFSKPYMTPVVRSVTIERPITYRTVRQQAYEDKPGRTSEKEAKMGFRTYTALADVSYGVEIQFMSRPIWSPTRPNEREPHAIKAYLAQFRRRLERQTCYRPVHLGVKGTESTVHFEACDSGDFTPCQDINLDLGIIPFGRVYDQNPIYWNGHKPCRISEILFAAAIIEKGVLKYPLPGDPCIFSQKV